MPFYIGCDPTDVPTAAAGGKVERPILPPRIMYLSSSIWLTNLDGTTVADGKARVGRPCQIRVRVDANAIDSPRPSEDITVQVWVCDFTLGVGPGGVRLGASMTETGLSDTPLDTDPADVCVVAVVDWTPSDGDLWNVDASSGEAHMCVGANAFYDATPPMEGNQLPTQVPPELLDVLNDEHHAQRNIAIVPATRARGDVELAMHNPDPDVTAFWFEARAVEGALGEVEREQLLALPFVERIGGKAFDPSEVLARGGVLGGPIERLALNAGGKLALASDRIPLHVPRSGLEVLELEREGKVGDSLAFELPPADPERKPPFVALRVRLADPEDFGAVQAVDVIQRRGDESIVGGARILLVNVRPEDLRGMERGDG